MLLDLIQERALRVLGVYEELELHLLELPGAEEEITRRDLVAEGLPHLSDAERQLHARVVGYKLEVGEHELGGLRPEIGLRGAVLLRADHRREHQVEGLDFPKC